jgi:hypothetical protein
MNQQQLQIFTNWSDLPPIIPIISGVGRIFAGPEFLELVTVTSWIFQNRNQLAEVMRERKQYAQLPERTVSV